jgi:HK97 family phage major capsid protein
VRKAPATPKRETKPVYHERSEHSFFMDRAKRNDDYDARQRLAQNADHVAEQTRAMANVADHGDDAVVPLFLQDKFEKARLQGAVTSGLTNQQPIPPTGDTITIPFQTGNASVAALTQAQSPNALSTTDPELDAATASVVEVGGTVDLLNFVVERGSLGAGLDVVIANHLSELLADDEDQRVITAAIADAGVSVTYTTSTPTLADIYVKLADAIQQIHIDNKRPPSGIVVHPRRFAAWASELDSENRPLMVPMSVAMNPLAMTSGDGAPVAYGFTGYSIHGVPIYTDVNIPTTGGAGTNQDTVLVCDWKQQYTWLGPVLVDRDSSLLFKNSGITIRARRYFATMCAHRADAFGKITGTGLVAPTFTAP